jgi:hypothetical protein
MIKVGDQVYVDWAWVLAHEDADFVQALEEILVENVGSYYAPITVRAIAANGWLEFKEIPIELTIQEVKTSQDRISPLTDEEIIG